MKRTIFFVLGLLIASAMPGNGLRAQSIAIDVQVKTLDRAPLQSAKIYAGTVGVNYFVDSAHLSTEWTGDAAWIDTIGFANLAVSQGFNLLGSVDSLTFANAFIVAIDTNNVAYVLGVASRDMRDTGIFRAAELFSGITGSTLSDVMYANSHMLGTGRQVIVDNELFGYSALDKALGLSTDNALLTFVDTVTAATPMVLDHTVTIAQNGFPLVSTHTDAAYPLVKVDGVALRWNGSDQRDTVYTPNLSGTLFQVVDGRFEASKAVFNAGTQVASVEGNGSASFDSCTLVSASDAQTILLADSATAASEASAFPGSHIAAFASAATGSFSIDAATGNSRRSDIAADAFYKADASLLFHPTLQLAAANADDTVFLNRNTAAGTSDTIADAIVVDLNADTVKGVLVLAHNLGNVYLQNGVANIISGADGVTGSLVLSTLDSVGNLLPGSLQVRVNGGRYNVVTPSTGADVTVFDGKFNQQVDTYLAPRHVLVDNDESDAASFAYKVVSGYKVTFVNYNGRIGQPGYADSVAVVDRADNLIIPAPGRPAYVGADTVFSAYFIDDQFSRPWNFLEDVLTSDTTLYAEWNIFNSLTDARYTVYHRRQALDGTYPDAATDSVHKVGTIGTVISLSPYTYAGFVAQDLARVFVLNQDTTIEFLYTRDTFQIVYDLAGGSIISGVADTSYAFGTPLTHPTVSRPGHTFLTWSPYTPFMPAHDVTLTAIYSQNDYLVSWSSTDSTVVYNGQPVDGITASYIDDDGTTLNGTITITDANGNEVSEARTVGSYVLHVAPLDSEYHLIGMLSTNLTIEPAPVVVNGVSVETAKLYDGNANAEVLSAGTPTPIYGNDDVTVSTVAFYDDATTGENKNITAAHTLVGADAYNYTLPSANVVVSTTGAILAPVVLDASQADNGIDVSANGYCSGDASNIGYYLQSGNPDQYKLKFDSAAVAEGFSNVAWSAITTAGQLAIDIPVNAASGDYNVDVTFRNSNYPQFESSPISVTFHVNLSRNLTMPVFSDVISIVDTCHCIDQSSVKWYHNGTYLGTTDPNYHDGPYYQEVGGLTGTYHVELTINGSNDRTCEQTDVTTIVSEAPVEAVSVSAYPNPAVDQVNVTIEHSSNSTHSLQVMSVLGVTLVNTTFSGNDTTVDFSTLDVGSYTLVVDGIAVRVLKN